MPFSPNGVPSNAPKLVQARSHWVRFKPTSAWTSLGAEWVADPLAATVPPPETETLSEIFTESSICSSIRRPPESLILPIVADETPVARRVAVPPSDNSGGGSRHCSSCGASEQSGFRTRSRRQLGHFPCCFQVSLSSDPIPSRDLTPVSGTGVPQKGQRRSVNSTGAL
jgi:hypothetical protein